MATYFVDDFSSLAGWTKRWNTTPTWTAANPLQIPLGVTNDWCGLTLDAVDSDAERDDVEVLVEFTTLSTVGTQRFVAVRGAGADETATHLHITVTASQLSVGYCNGSDTRTAIQAASVSHSESTTYRLRARFIGSSIKARTWIATDTEPTTWPVDTTDTTVLAAGWVGLCTSANVNAQQISLFSVGTNGDTAPSSAPSSGNTIAVPAGALTLTKYAPTVTATANQSVAVPAGSLTLTGFAPTVQAGASQTIAVPAGSLSLTAVAPTVQVTSGSTILVPAGALSLTGYAPTVVNPNTVAVPAGSITLTGYAPTVVVRADQIVAVPAATLTLTGFAPGVAYTANNTISVPAGALSLTGYAPTVSNGEVVEVKRQTGAGRPRRRQRVVIAIDGEDFVVESEEEAVALLDQAKEAAQEKAEQAIKRAAAARKREPRKVLADASKALEVPTITAEGMSDYAAETVAAIEELYRSAMRTIEVAAMLSRRDRDEEDDEEVLFLLA